VQALKTLAILDFASALLGYSGPSLEPFANFTALEIHPLKMGFRDSLASTLSNLDIKNL